MILSLTHIKKWWRPMFFPANGKMKSGEMPKFSLKVLQGRRFCRIVSTSDRVSYPDSRPLCFIFFNLSNILVELSFQLSFLFSLSSYLHQIQLMKCFSSLFLASFSSDSPEMYRWTASGQRSRSQLDNQLRSNQLKGRWIQCLKVANSDS